MTRTANARVAGVTFLLYIVTGLSSMALTGVDNADNPAARLATIAMHPWATRISVVAALLSAAYALVLGVTLYALTRDEDRELATVALCCRAGEGLISAISSVRSLALLTIATASTTAGTDAAATQALGSLLLKMGGWTTLIAAICFSVGSTLFAYLFLRARSIPVSLAWLGLVASVLLIPLLPMQLVGLLPAQVASLMWLPMLVFEVVLAGWLIVKGTTVPRKMSAGA